MGDYDHLPPHIRERVMRDAEEQSERIRASLQQRPTPEKMEEIRSIHASILADPRWRDEHNWRFPALLLNELDATLAENRRLKSRLADFIGEEDAGISG
jgi:hypothetical protein